jgi:hypothetical protein
MGVEPTLGRANDRADGFEDREAHPGPYTSVRAYTPVSCGRRGEEARILCHAGPTLVNLPPYRPESRGLSPLQQYARLATVAIPPRRGMGAGAESRERRGG